MNSLVLACKAESTLLKYYDTVEIRNIPELVLNADEYCNNIITPSVGEAYENAAVSLNIKSIMRSSANNFFRK